MINGNAISVNGDKINDVEAEITKDMFIDNKYIVIRKGKKKYFVGSNKE